MFARYYSAATTRFLSVDPKSVKSDRIRIPQRLNRYAYVAGNPMAYIDPNGRDLFMASDADGYDRMVNGIARLLGSPEGRKMVESADKASFAVKMKVADLGPRKGNIGQKTRDDGLTTTGTSTTKDGKKVSAPIEEEGGARAIVTLSTRSNDDPAALAHELGGHLKEFLADTDPEMGGDYIVDQYDKDDHSGGEAAEEATEDAPAKPSEANVAEAKKILERRQ